MHCALHAPTSKFVAASGRTLGARGVMGGALLLNTMLQPPLVKVADEVVVELPQRYLPQLAKDLDALMLMVKPECFKGIKSILSQVSDDKAATSATPSKVCPPPHFSRHQPLVVSVSVFGFFCIVCLGFLQREAEDPSGDI